MSPLTRTEPTIAEKFTAKRQAWARCSGLLMTTHRVYQGDARLMRELDGRRESGDSVETALARNGTRRQSMSLARTMKHYAPKPDLARQLPLVG